MNSLRKTINLAQMGRRLASAEAKVTPPSAFRMKQEKMQIPDGRPVHIKGGTMDTIMMQATFLVCLVGLGSCLKLYYDLSVPKK